MTVNRIQAHVRSGNCAARYASGVLASLLLTALLAGCGGGESKTGSNGTGLVPPMTDAFVASGAVAALGPTTVGGTAFDDSGAQPQINAEAPRTPADIRLGMLVEAGGTIVSNAAAGTVRTMIAQSAVIGTVSAVDLAAQRMTVLSLPVQLDQNTILDGVSALSSVAIGARVEVFGYTVPPAATVFATRIVARAANASAPVELLGTTGAATGSQFTVQGLTVATGAATLAMVGGVVPSPAVPVSSLGNNVRVRVIGTFDANSNTIVAAQVLNGLASVRDDNSVIVLDGIVQSVTSPGRFRLSDTDVDAGTVGGAAAVPGARVQVRGRKLLGVLTASEFRVISAGTRIEYSLQGEIANFASIASFMVRGELIDASAAIVTGGLAIDLANGRRVRVKASAGPGRLSASEVAFVP